MTDNTSHTLFITGCSGYVGAMLVDQFSKRDDVAHIVGVDKDPLPDFVADNEKLMFINTNLADGGWQDEVASYQPDVVIHTAWQIREMYGDQYTQWKWNVEGADAVFSFAFTHLFVRRLIYFSTVAVYGAEPENSLEGRFVEDDPMQEDEYLYGVEKRVSEERLGEKYDNAAHRPQVFVVRPAAITGPRGRYMRTRFGLQSALSGQLKDSPSLAHRIVSKLVSFVPITKKWCRQFIHEDDVTDIVELLSFEANGGYEVFNICPPGDIVRGKDMARAVGKKAVTVPPLLIRVVYFFAWHLSRGAIPTSRGGWKFYSYPVAVDGSKITERYGYEYQYEPYESFTKLAGRYASYVVKDKDADEG